MRVALVSILSGNRSADIIHEFVTVVRAPLDLVALAVLNEVFACVLWEVIETKDFLAV